MRKLIILTKSAVMMHALFSLNAFANDEIAFKKIFALNETKKDTAGFIEDSHLSIQLKNFWIDNDNRDHNDFTGQTREWGQGFVAQYKSGFTQGTIGFGIDAIAMYGLRLDDGGRSGKSNIDRTPGNIFPLKTNGKAKHGFSSAGVAPKLRVSNTIIQHGTLMPKLPVINSNNERLLPQTYNGTVITVNELKNFNLVAGKIEYSKEVNSTNRNTLAVDGASKGIGTNKFYFAGVDYKITKDLMLQYYAAHLTNFYAQNFVGLTNNWQLPADAGGLKLDLRYFYSDSSGKNSNVRGRAKGYKIKGYKNAGEVDNKVLSGFLTYRINQHQILAGYQVLYGKSNFPFISQVSSQSAPVASAYLFSNSQIGKFVNAGERTWMVGYNYSFDNFGLPGLSTSIKYLKGNHIKSAIAKRKEWERDFILSYKIQTGFLEGLEFSWRNASLRSNVPNTKDLDRNRLIVTYDFLL